MILSVFDTIAKQIFDGISSRSRQGETHPLGFSSVTSVTSQEIQFQRRGDFHE